ncbi:hypothetical protein [Mycobacterium sp. 852013-50091_SCH5140682]|nr:hypothetical protein [Mycobacterium sp. 852013-50091_SCH5140682]
MIRETVTPIAWLIVAMTIVVGAVFFLPPTANPDLAAPMAVSGERR